MQSVSDAAWLGLSAFITTLERSGHPIRPFLFGAIIQTI